MADKGMDHCANPHKRSVRQDEISSQYPCMGAQVSGSRHSGRSVVCSYQFLAWKVLNPLAPAKEGVPSSRALVLQERTTSPHTPIRPRLVLPLFSISLSSTRCKTPPAARRSHTTQLLFQSSSTLVTRSFNLLDSKTDDQKPVARSFPGLTFQLSTYGRPTEIDSSTPISKLAPIFEHQRASAGTLTTPSPNSDPAAGTRRKSSSSFWGSVMSSRKPSHYQTDSAHSAKIAVYSSTTDCDADDEATMSAEESSQQVRPMSVHMAASAPSSAASSTRPMSEAAPFCPRRPNLREILANTAPAPWTLAAFMAYLSNNHCLETLEFTMDAGRYKKHYHRMMNKAPVPGQPTETDANYVKELWDRLMEAYIQPNGSREVNLPSQVRDPILEHKPENRLPPAPTILEPAVSKTYELMEESVLVPFLNSVYPQSPTPVSPYYPSNSNNSNESMTPVEEKSRFGRRSRHSSRGSPPPLSASSAEFSAASYSPPSLNNRKSAPSALTTALSRHRFSQKLSPTSSAPSHSLSAALSTASSASDAIYSGPGLTDDSGSSGSPINDCPMTPPVTPPMSDISGSPKTNRDSGAWKKLGRLSGWKPSRKRGQPGFDLHTT
ncbi:regulator of G protein signaling superfamily [Aureobasidium pullulans]|nr:regulator of G protein signaling superfamily [Aureobasidium pullulans]